MPCVTGRVTVLVLAEEAAVQALCMAIPMPDVLLERLADQATNFALKLLDLCSVEELVGVQQALVVETLTTGGHTWSPLLGAGATRLGNTAVRLLVLVLFESA